MPRYQDKGWEKKRDGSGGLFGGNHVPPEPRNPRPKGAQRGVVRRDGQRGNFGYGSRSRERSWWR